MPAPFPDDLRHFVESTKWTFAKTYAATWPHEYVVRTPENAPMILALARHIFEYGTEERFYSQVRKYHHEGGKVYWSMDSTPETTVLINRCDETATYEARLTAGTLPMPTGGFAMDHRDFDQKWNRCAALSLMGGLVITIGGAVLVMILCPQPSWENQQTFVAAYHPFQSLIFVPSLALPLSIIAVLVGFHSSARPDAKPWTLLALVWGAVGATILCINYLIQGVFVPSLIRQSSGLVSALVSANPGSLFWTLELFGYGIVGLAMWGAAPFFSGPGIDRIIRWLLVVNGVGSILAGLGATVDSSWVLGPLGLGAVLVWNLLMIVLAALFLLRSRQEVG